LNPYIQGLVEVGNIMGDGTIKILGLSGEYRATSKSGMLVNAALSMAEKKGAEVVFWDLAEKPLPLVGEEGCWAHPNVKEFQTLLEESQAFFLSSPEYHGTMSGVMKNTMDWMYDKHVGGKVFGLMSTLGGVTNANTLNHMRIALRWLHGWPVPEQLAIGHVKEAFDEEGQLVDESLQQRLEKLVDAVLSASKKLSA
jgi:NAD(P)H-dependent FMN reductase